METNKISNSGWNTHVSTMPSIFDTQKKEVIVVDVNYLSAEDKLDLKSYRELFEGYIVVFIDSSKQNTQQSYMPNNLPIYKL